MYYGSINGILERDPNERIHGAWVATNEFYKALLTYGSFEGYHLFVKDSSVHDVESNLGELYSHLRNYDKLKIVGLSRLNEYVSKYDYAVFHQSDPTPLYFLKMREYFWDKNVPVSCFVHNASSPGTFALLRSYLYADNYPFDTIICATSSLKICIERIFQYSREEARSSAKFEGKIEVIPFGIDVERFVPRTKSEIREELGFHRDDFLIGYIGRITSRTKMDLLPLIRIFALLLDQVKSTQLRLYIIGKDQEDGYINLLRRKAILMGIADKVRFVTDHSNSDMHKYFSALDIFVSPCDHIGETFGITPIEAMSCGVPVVVSDWNGYKETIRNGYNGFKIPTYWHEACDFHDISYELDDFTRKYSIFSQTVAVDIPSFVKTLRRLFDEEELRTKISANGREWILNNYSWEKIIGKYERLWRQKYEESSSYSMRKKKERKRVLYDTFSHYSTRALSEQDFVVSTKHVVIKEASEIYVIVPKAMKGLIFPKDVTMVRELAATPISIHNAYAETLLKSPRLTRENFMIIILWMIKHGYLELVTPTTESTDQN